MRVLASHDVCMGWIVLCGVTSVLKCCFGQGELQTLISGAETGMDVDDFWAHARFSGYTSNEPYMQDLLSLLRELTPEQQRDFLQFATSCSRPPLLGFQ